MSLVKDLKRFEGRELPYGLYFGKYLVSDEEVNQFVRYRLVLSVPWLRSRKCYIAFRLDGKYGLQLNYESF